MEHDHLDRQTDYLSKSNTNNIKGIFAVLVVLCHIWGRIAADVNTSNFIIANLGRLFSIMGYISVSIFFFISGYGLMLQYKEKGREYIKKFPKRNILPLYIINIILIIAYSLFYFFLEDAFSLRVFIQSFFFGKTVVSNGWYLQAILLFYLAYYLVFMLIKRDGLKLGVLGLFLSAYCILCGLFLKLSSTWYECSFTFLLGMVWYNYRAKVEDFLKKRSRYIFCLVSSFVAFVVLCYSSMTFSLRGMEVVLKIFSTIVFCALVLLIIMKIKVKNVITAFLGTLYLEIYVLQGFFLNVFKSNVLNIHNPLLYGLAVMTCTILVAYILHPLFQKIIKVFKK